MNYTVALAISAVLGLVAYLATRAITKWLSRPHSGVIEIRTPAGEHISLAADELANEDIGGMLAALKNEKRRPEGVRGLLYGLSGAGLPWVMGATVFSVACLSASVLVHKYYGGGGVPTPTPVASPSPQPTIILGDNYRGVPSDLFEIIKESQRAYVKASTGTNVSEAFTDEDLRNFIDGKAPEKIVGQLSGDKTFLKVVLAIKGMEPGERDALLANAYKTYKPTWAQLGKIDPSGQTVAGQQAEKLIAKAIVDEVKELCSRPLEE